MVIASDGVWEFLSNEDVIDIVNKCNGDADRACQEVHMPPQCPRVIFHT